MKAKLESYLDKSIENICTNNFHNRNSNHCAHFVSHALDLTFDFNCRSYRGGANDGANIRVHEIFAQCPKVGAIEDAPDDVVFLIFVTARENVNISRKRMINVPKKHIGICIQNTVYHYSNSNNKVMKCSVDTFLTIFQRAYSGNQKLFYGLVPNSDLELKIDVTGNTIDNNVSFELIKEEREWYAQVKKNHTDKDKFFIGREINSPSNRYFGIYQRVSEYSGFKFDAERYKDVIDHWAYLLFISGFCESKNHFNLVNTYDRAKFTFGFYQLAAHTPDDNLILLFRRLTENSSLTKYFPELKMIDGKLHRVNQNGGKTNLETVMRTGPNGRRQLQLFMNFLNPLRKPIDEQEILNAARLIHWTKNDEAMRQIQVETANELLQTRMTKYHRWYNLDGKSDVICALVADIHHQGRASKNKVARALNSSNPEESLILANPNYTGRIANLRTILKALRDAGKIGVKIYDASNNEFLG